MVAIVGGNGLGLNLGSLASLGRRGVIGSPLQGRSGERSYVNVANGNLVLQALDVSLLGRGPDAAALRTYNSQGGFDFDNGDGWIGAATRTVTRSGADLVRTDADGSQCTYVLGAGGLYYAQVSPGSAVDTISANQDGTFTWTDGASGNRELYQGTGRGFLLQEEDTSGNRLVYGYDAQERLETVRTTNGTTATTDDEIVRYAWTGQQLTGIQTELSDGRILQQVSYGYDARGRLETVRVKLAPEGALPQNAETLTEYVTTYGYDGVSDRVATVTESDGSTLGFQYVNVGGEQRIWKVTDGAGKVTTFDYGVAGQTTVTDELNVSTVYKYEAEGRLTEIRTGVTAGNAEGLSRVSYGYDGLGNVQLITDGLGNHVQMEYDAAGNLRRQVDALGNAVERTYTAQNRLETETTHPTAGQSLVTRYVYDAAGKGLLRFAVSAEGRVTEHRYDGWGERVASISYAGGTYDTSGLGATAVPTEAQLATWAAGQDRTRTQRSDMAYDFRGQLQSATAYGEVAANGEGVAGTAATTRYVYDQRGLLRTATSADGRKVTDVVYDGLGREVSRRSHSPDGTPAATALSQLVLTQYDDANGRTTVELANGLRTTSAYDHAGRLVSVMQASGAQGLGTTRYAYDADGRLLMTEDPTGQRSFHVYDASGRRVAEVNAAGTLTEFVYDAAGQVTEVIGYATPVPAALLVDAGGVPTGASLSALRPGTTAQDTRSWNVFDEAGRLAWQIDALGYATRTEYDGVGHVLSVTRLATPVDTSQLGNGQGIEVVLGAFGTTTALAVQAGSGGPNAARLLTATVSSNRGEGAPAPTGLVTFFAGEVCLGAAALVDGVATLSVTNLPVGSNALRASYAGDLANVGSASAAVAETVTAAATTSTSLSVSGGASATGALVLTATVSGGMSPSGTVTFYQGDVALGTAAVAGGVASLQITGLPAGTAALSAAYQGDAANARSTSAVVSRAIARASTGVTLYVQGDQGWSHRPVAGEAVTLVAEVTNGANAGGRMQFFDGARLLGEVDVSAGIASLVVTDLPAGTASLRASYLGDANNLAAASTSASKVVVAPTTTTLQAVPASAALGAPVVLTATVAGASPGGTVTFYDASGVLGSAQVVGGVAKLVLDGLAAGSYAPSAVYSGDAANGTSQTATPAAFTVGQAPTTTVLATERVNGSSLKLTATVTGTGNPAGPVTFFEGANTLGTVMLVNGQATLTVNLAAGTHGSLRADFAGGQANAASSSALATEYLTLPATTTALTSSAATIVQGQSLTLTARVTRAGATPTGTVTFLQGTTVLGTATLSAGQATLAVTTLPAGSVPVTVAYSGDASNAGSIGTLTQTVTAAASTVTLQAASTTAVQGTGMLLTARVTSAASSRPSGTVTFLDGATVLGTGTLVNGVATYSAANLTPGARQLTARFEGDASSAVATSAAVAETVLPRPATVTVTSSAPAGGIAAGTAFTLTAQVTGASPTGTVTFLDGQTVIGTAAVGANGQAQLATARMYTAGNPRTVTATYAGDAANGTASGTVSVRVNGTATAPAGPPVTTTALAVTPTTAVTRGMPVTLTATVTGGTSGRTITGTVSFFNGTTLVGSATVSGGQARLTLTNLPVATASFKAVYSGDTYARTSTNATAVTKAVGKASTVTTLLTPAAQVRTGSPVTLVAQVAGAAPGGTVTFRNGTTSLGTGTVGANGLATLTLGSMAAGSYTTLNALYAGDNNNNTSTSANVSMTVLSALGTSSTALSVSPALPQAAGAQVTLTATVTGTSPSGTVSFYNGGTLLGSAAVSGGTAQLKVDDLAGGAAQLRAVYSGSATLVSSASAVVNGNVNPAATTTVLSTASGPGSLTLTATVAGAGNPAGEVIFRNGATEIGRATLANGRAVLTLTGLAAAVYDLKADYQGNAANAQSSSAVTQDAVAAATATSITRTSAASISIIQALTVQVSGTNPTGTVTFLSGGKVLGTATVSGGFATLFGAELPVGDVQITAAYSGDATNAASVLTFTQSVQRLGSGILVTVSPGGTVSQSTTLVLHAEISGAGATGTVTFTDGATVLGTAQVRNGVAALAVSGLAAGTRSIVATYSGDDRHTGSSVSGQEVIAAAPVHVSLSTSAAQVARGGTLTLTARVTGNVPSGRVAFVSGTTVLGSAAVLNGVAALTLENLALPEGSAPITAVYGGDAQNASTVSAAVVETITAGQVTQGTAAGGVGVAAIRSTADRIATSIHGRDGQLLGTIDAEGYLTELVYDSAGRVVETIAWATRVAGFEDVTNIAPAVAAARAAGSLQGLRPGADPGADVHAFTYYDARGLKVASVDGEGYLTEIAYDAEGRVTSTTRWAKKAVGTPTASSSVSSLRPTADGEDQTSASTYDDLGRLSTQQNAEGTLTRFRYDEVGNLVETTVAADTADRRSALVRYDVQGRVAAELSGEGAALAAAAQSAGEVEAVWASHAVHHAYDGAGRRLSTTDALGHRTVLLYDDAGWVRYTVNPEGEVAEQRYDGLGRVQASVQHARALSAATTAGLQGGLLTATGNAAGAAALAALGDAQDGVTTFAYDGRGLLQRTTDALGGTTETVRDAFGGAVETRQSIDDARALVTTAEFDRRGLQTRAVADLGDATHVNAVTRAEYDGFGRLRYAWDANGNRRETRYDRDGRIVETVDPLNAHRYTTYDAFSRVLTQTNALGHTTGYAYDTAARKVTVTTPEGIAVSTVRDRFGQTLEVTDGNGNTTRYEYDRSGRLLRTQAPLGAGTLLAAESAYDRAGRVVDTWDASRNRVHYDYDAASRLLTRTVDPSGLALVTEYGYDEKGQQVTVKDANGVFTRTEYDAKGQVVTQTVDPTDLNPQGLNLVTRYTYDDRGKVLTVEAPGQTVTEHRYDDLGRRIETVVDPGGLRLTETFRYDAAGNMTVRANGATGRQFIYDAAGRLEVEFGGVQNSDTIEYAYDAEGRVVCTAKSTNNPYGTRLQVGLSYASIEISSYDKDGRLVLSVDGACRATSYRYDGNGNVVDRISHANTGSYSFNWPPGSFTAAAPASDPTRDLHVRTVYDKLNRAAFTIDGTGAVVEQTYDGVGNVVDRKAYGTRLDAEALALVDGLRDSLLHVAPEGREAIRQTLEATLRQAVTALADPSRDAHIRRVYDAANRLRWSVDGVGSVTRQDFDRNGNLVRQVAYATTIGGADAPQSVASTAADRVAVSIYDRANRLTHRVDALGGGTEQVYDAAGNVVKRIAHGNRVAAPSASGALPTAATATPAASPLDRVTRAAYDRGGRLVYAVDATGGVTETRYDAAGRVTKTVAYAKALTDAEIAALPTPGTVAALDTLMAGKRDANRDRTTKTYYWPSGLVSYTVDAEGYWTAKQLDGAGNLVGTWTYPDRPASWKPFDESRASEPNYLSNYLGGYGGGGLARMERFIYDAGGRLAATVDALDQVESYGYDGIGNKTSFTNKNRVTWSYGYDAAGRLVEETTPQVEIATTRENAAGGLELQSTESAGVVTRIAYDALGNVTSRTEASGRPEERTTRFGYDALGHQILTVHAAVGVYDAASDDLAVNDATGLARVETVQELTTQVVYDSFGDAVACVDVAGNVSYKSYDELGRVQYEVDALGYVTGHARNVFGDEETLTRYAVATDLIATSTQPPGAAEIEAALGALDHAGDRAIRTEYDRMGRATRVTQPEVWTFNGHDEANGDLGQLYRKSPVVEHVYDAFGQRVQTRLLVDKTALTGHPPHFSTNTWATTTHFFDRRGLEVASVDAKGYGTIQEYDAAGNVTRRMENAWAIDSWESQNNGSAYGTTLAVGASGVPNALTGSPYVRVGRETVYTYDKLNRRKTETRKVDAGSLNALDATTSYDYDAVGNQTVLTDGLGAKTYTFYDALGRTRAVAAPTRSSTADGSSLTPLTVFRRDALGNVVEQIDYARGSGLDGQGRPTAVAAAEDPAGDRHTLTRYDALGHAAQVTDALGQSRYLSYDAGGHLAKQWQGVTVLDVVDPGAPGTLRTLAAAFEYDALGRQIRVVTPGVGTVVQGGDIVAAGPGTLTTAMRYNAFGEVVARGAYATGAEPTFQEFFDYDAAGRMWRTNTGDGLVRVKLYDLLGNETAVVTSAGSDGSATDMGVDLKAISDAGVGLLASWVEGVQTFRPAAGLRVTTSRYDILGRAVKQTLAWREDAAGPYRPVVLREFDRWGSVTAESTPVAQRGGILASQPVYTYYAYNHLGQLSSKTAPAVGSIDAYGNTTSVTPVTTYTYDKLGRLTATTDANQHVSGQEWDAAGQLIAETHADGGVVRRAYDAFGGQVKLTDAENHSTAYAYDRLGRNTRITSDPVEVGAVSELANGTLVPWAYASGRLVTSFEYDEAGNRISESKSSDAFYGGYPAPEATRHAFDLRGNMVATMEPGGSAFVSRSAFDAWGRKVGDRDAAGGIQTWEYDAFGQLQVQWDLGGSRHGLVYDNARQLVHKSTSRIRGVDQDLSYAYDAAGQLVAIHDGSLGQDSAYQYNAAGQRVVEKTTQGGIVHQNQTLSYDALGRLQRVESFVDETTIDKNGVESKTGVVRPDVDLAYAYDAVGNRLRTVTTYYVATPHSVEDLVWTQLTDPYEGTPLFDYNTDPPTPIMGWVGVGTYHIEYTWAATTETRYFAYDAMNRQILADGALNGHVDPTTGTPDLANVTKDQGHILTYDKNGNRTSDVAWGKQTRELPRTGAWYAPDPDYGSVQSWPSGEPAGTADGQTTTRTFDYGDGNVQTVTYTWYFDAQAYATPEGATKLSFEYDALNRLKTSYGTYQDGANAEHQVRLDTRTYDAASRVTESTGPEAGPYERMSRILAGRSDAGGFARRVSLYDANGRLDRQQNYKNSADGNGNLAPALDYTLEYGRISKVPMRQRSPQAVGPNDGRTLYLADWTVVDTAIRRDAGGNAVLDVPGGTAVYVWVDYGGDMGGGYEAIGTVELLIDSATGQPVLPTVLVDADVSGYDAAGNPVGYRTIPASGPSTVYDISYAKFDAYRQYQVVGRRSDNGGNPGTTTATYDANGFLVGLNDSTQGANNRTFVNDANGVALLKRQENHRLRQLVVNGQVAAVYGEEAPGYAKTGDFDLVFDPITASSASSMSQVQVNPGDSLQSIAQRVYGDASLWYLIADANGLTGDNLKVGMTVDIPARVTGLHNSADTFKPYDPSRITGDTTPNLPAPRAKKGCGGIGLIIAIVIVVVVAVVATIVTAGAAAVALAPAGSALASASVFAAGTAALAGGGIAGLSAGIAVTAAVVGGAVGSIASQLVGMAIGLQEDFSWSQVALGGIGAGVGAGIGAAASGITQGLSGPASWAAAGAKAAVANAATQGVANLVGLQDGFSWRSVAIGAVSASVGAMAGEVAGTALKDSGLDKFTRGLITGTAAGMASGVTAAAMRGGRIDMVRISADAFGNALASSLQEKLAGPSEQELKAEAQAREEADRKHAEAMARQREAEAMPAAPPPVRDESAANKEQLDDALNKAAPTEDAPAEPQKVKAVKGDSISKIMGTSDPAAVGAFMRANGLKNSNIIAGKDYVLPTEILDGDATGGQRALNADNARAEAIAAKKQAEVEAKSRPGMAELTRDYAAAERQVAANAAASAAAARAAPADESLLGQVGAWIDKERASDTGFYSRVIDKADGAGTAILGRIGRAFTNAGYDVLETGLGLARLADRLGDAAAYAVAHPIDTVEKTYAGVERAASAAADYVSTHSVEAMAGDAASAVSGAAKSAYAKAEHYVQTTSIDQMGEDALRFGAAALAEAGVAKAAGAAVKAVSTETKLAEVASTASKGPDGRFYSVAYEMELSPADIGRSRSVHFNRANAALDAALDADPQFAKMMDDLIPNVKQAVSSVGGRDTPADWVWHHHPTRPGVLQLVPEVQHQPGSIFQGVLHPNGSGGYSNWAIPAGAPRK